MDPVKIAAGVALHAKIRGVDPRLLRLSTTLLGQDREHFLLSRLQFARERLPAPGFEQANRDNQRLRLLVCQHQRRQVKTRHQPVSAPCLAFHRHAGKRQVANIAVDGAFGHAKSVRQMRCRCQTPAPQDLHYLEQTVSASGHWFVNSQAG